MRHDKAIESFIKHFNKHIIVSSGQRGCFLDIPEHENLVVLGKMIQFQGHPMRFLSEAIIYDPEEPISDSVERVHAYCPGMEEDEVLALFKTAGLIRS